MRSTLLAHKHNHETRNMNSPGYFYWHTSTHVQGVAYDSFTAFADDVGTSDGVQAPEAWAALNDMKIGETKSGDPGGFMRLKHVTGKARLFGLTAPSAWKDTRSFLLGGWKEGLATMRDGIGTLKLPPAQDLRRRNVWSDNGDDLCISRYVAGNAATSWRATQRRITKAPPKVRLVVDLAYWCSACGYKMHDAEPTKPEEMLWRGAACCILAEKLSRAGWQVEIVAGEVSTPELRGNPERFSTTAFGYLVKVKGFGQPLNLAAAAAMTGHAAAARQGGNLALAKHATNTSGAAADCGLRLALLPETFYTTLGFPKVPNTLYVPSGALTKEAAQAWVAQALATLQSRTL